MSEPRILPVSREHQERLARLKRDREALQPEPPPGDEPLPDTLDAMIEAELKKQMRTRTVPRELDWTITTAIKFLAVRAKLPVAFGGELDEPLERESPS